MFVLKSVHLLIFKGKKHGLMKFMGRKSFWIGKSNFVMVNPKRCTSPKKFFMPDMTRMIDMVAEDWNQYWQRDHNYKFDDVWDSLTEQFHSLEDCPTCEYRQFDLQEWYHTLGKSSTRSARGSCAFTIKELKIMPPVLTQWLFGIYHLIENGCKWPHILVHARVVMIPKQDRPPRRGLIFDPLLFLADYIDVGPNTDQRKQSNMLLVVFHRRLEALSLASQLTCLLHGSSISSRAMLKVTPHPVVLW